MNTLSTTVLIPVHNEAKTLRKTFKSLEAQTTQSFSIICIDDASTDDSYSILQDWQNRFGKSRLSIIRNEENIGITKSLNKALELQDTRYIARVDAGDWWEKDKLASQISFLQNHPEYGIVGCNYINIFTNKKNYIVVPETNGAITKSIFKQNPFAHSAVVYRASLIKKVGNYNKDIRYGQDYELWLRLMPHTKFYNLQRFLCLRSAGYGISVEKQNAQMLQCVKTQIKYLRKYKRSILEYRFILLPLAIAITPKWVHVLKRMYFA